MHNTPISLAAQATDTKHPCQFDTLDWIAAFSCIATPAYIINLMCFA